MNTPTTPSNGGDPASKAHQLGEQIAAGIMEGQKTNQRKGLEALSTGIVSMTKWGIGTFFVPFVALYAWGGMAPESWEQQGYWPVVAGFYVFRQVANWAHGKSLFTSGDTT